MTTTPPVIHQSAIERAAEKLYALKPLFNRDGDPYTWKQLDALDKKYKEKYFVHAMAALQSLGDEWCLGWQPIKTAPRDGSLVLATSILNHNTYVVGWCSTKSEDWHDDEGHWGNASLYLNANFFTHWMPLPKPPAHTQPDTVKE